MVYRGRPSTGCKSCRERKIKCDETPDGCLKCAKAKITCPGYDRGVDVFFHDETARTRTKARTAKAKAIALRDAQHTRASSTSSDDVVPFPFHAQHTRTPPTKESPGILLLAPLVDQGIAYFMSHYAIGLDQPSIQSDAFNRHLATNGFHPLVATSMTALGLAGVANIYQDTALKRKATSWYLDAIKMTNSAITSPKDVTSDTTLLAITLLGMFEATANEHTLHAWGEHVAGAASLVKLRGMHQFATPTGRRMYLHAIGLLTMNCLADGTPLPPYVQAMNAEILKHADGRDPRTRFFFLQQDAINLRADIIQDRYMDLQTMLDRALALDAAAERVFEHAGPEWRYDVVTLDEPSPLVYGQTYHIYPSHATAQTRNWVRYTKIYIHDIIRNAVLAGLAASPPVLASATHLALLGRSMAELQRAQSHILASMPQFLHDVSHFAPSDARRRPTPVSNEASPTPRPFTPTHKLFFHNFAHELLPTDPPPSSTSTHASASRMPIVRVSGGHSTLWALYMAGATPHADRAVQAFVLRSLRRFERDFGIMQARVLRGALGVLIASRRTESGMGREGICPEYLPSQPAPYVVPVDIDDGGECSVEFA